MNKLLSQLRFWFKDRLRYVLLGGKCPRCGSKLHLNALGFHNCGPCFRRLSNAYLGEEDDF